MEFRKIIAAVLLVGLQLGCHRQGEPVNKHEALKAEMDIKNMSQEQIMSEIDLKGIYTAVNDPKADTYEAVIKPLEPYILNEDVLQNKKIVLSEEMTTSLQYFNWGLLKLIIEKSPHIDADKLLARYDRVLLAGCNDKLQNCENLSFFAKDPASSKIAGYLAREQKPIFEFYKRLFIAFQIKNSVPDPNLTELYLSRSTEFINELQRSKDADHEDLLKRHRNILTLIFQTGDSLNQKKLLSESFESFGPWSVSKISPHPLGSQAEEMFASASKNFIYDGKRELHPSLQRFMSESQKGDDSFLSRQKQIPDNVLKNLDIKPVVLDEYFFVVDRLYNGHIGMDMAINFWSGTKKDQRALRDTLIRYTQIQMGYLMAESNRYMNKYFSTTEKMVIGQMLEDAVSKSEEIGEKWKTFLRNAAVLGDFAGRVFRTLGPNPNYSETAAFFASLPNTIKYSVAVPQMMVLIYFMAKYDFSRTFYSWGRRVTVSSEKIVEIYFQDLKTADDQREIWFDYGNDKKVLLPSELLVAFQFALNNGTFTAFNVDPAEFVAVISQKLLGSKTSDISNNLIKFRAPFENGGEWKNLVKMCDAIKQGSAFSLFYSLEEIEKSLSMGGLFGALTGAFSGFSTGATDVGIGNQSKTTAMLNFYPYGYASIDQLERLRIEIAPTLEFVRGLKTVYSKYLKQHGLADEDINKKTVSIEGQIRNVEQAKARYISFYFETQKKYSECYFPLVEHELKLEEGAFQAEKKFLRSVYRDMTAARAHPDQVRALNAKYKFKGLPGGFTGFNRFNGDTFRSYKVDFYLRLKGYLESGLEPSIHVQVPDNLSETELYTNRGFMSLQYVPGNEEKFVADGLRVFSYANPRWVYWFNKGGAFVNSEDWPDWSFAVADLYRLGQMAGENGKTYSLDVNELVELPLKMVALLSITPTQEEILRTLGLSFRFGTQGEVVFKDDKTSLNSVYVNSYLERMFVKAGTNVPVSYHNAMYLWLYYDYLGAYNFEFLPSCENGVCANPPMTMLPILWQAERYYKSRLNADTFAFNLPTPTEEVTTPWYKNAVREEFARVFKFEKAVDARYRADVNSQKVPVYRPTLDGAYTLPYLTWTQKSDFRGRICRFQSKTGLFYDDVISDLLPKESCSLNSSQK